MDEFVEIRIPQMLGFCSRISSPTFAQSGFSYSLDPSLIESLKGLSRYFRGEQSSPLGLSLGAKYHLEWISFALISTDLSSAILL